MGWFNDVADAITETANKVGDAAKDAANTVADGAKDAANKVADGVKDAANQVAGGATSAANSVANSFTDAAQTVSSGAVDAWKATSDEASAIADGVQNTGMVIGDGFVSGSKIMASALETAAEQTGKGLVEAGRYISRHLCDVAIGSALSAAFVALAADGQEEAGVGALAALAATQFADKAALNSAARALALTISVGIGAIPHVEEAFDGHDHMVDGLTFIIVKACTQDPKMVVGTGGQMLAGALIYGITSVVCEGELPGGFSVWKGSNGMAGV